MSDIASFSDFELYTVKSLTSLRKQKGAFVVKVLWRGFPASFASWEPAEIMYEDVPKMFNEFLTSFPNARLAAEVRRHLSTL